MKSLHMLLVVTSLLFWQHCYSQTSILTLSDLSVSATPADSTMIQKITFNVNQPDLLDSLYILFGTTQDIGDLLKIAGKQYYFGTSNRYALQFDNHSPVPVSTTISLSEQLSSVSYADLRKITIYAKSKEGSYTNRLYSSH